MRPSILLILALRLAGPMIFCSGADALTIAWADLSNTAAFRPVAVELEGAGTARGVILGQDDRGLLLRVEGPKPHKLFNGGAEVRIERTRIRRVRVVKDPKRTSGRVAGVLLGFWLGGALGSAAGGGEQNLGGGIGMLCGPVLGYYTGKSFDKATLEITILDPAASPVTGAAAKRAERLPHYLAR